MSKIILNDAEQFVLLKNVSQSNLPSTCKQVPVEIDSEVLAESMSANQCNVENISTCSTKLNNTALE